MTQETGTPSDAHRPIRGSVAFLNGVQRGLELLMATVEVEIADERRAIQRIQTDLDTTDDVCLPRLKWVG